jgi:hypothetical protein
MRWPIATYSDRLWLAVDGSATAAGTIEVTAALTAKDVKFWQTVQADLDDIAVYAADGVTGYEYDIASLSYAGKSVTVEANDVTHHVTNTITVLQVVFGNATAIDGKDPFVPAGALTGYTLNVGPAPGEPVFTLANPIGETVPGQNMRKRASEVVFAWFQIGPFGTLSTPYNGRLFGEGPQSLSVTAPIGLTAPTSALRVWQSDNGALLCRMTISGGTDANSYDLVLNVVTTEGRTLQGVVRVEVND